MRALEQFSSPTPVTYQRARAAVDRFLAQQTQPFSLGSLGNDNPLCNFEMNVTSGLGGDN